MYWLALLLVLLVPAAIKTSRDFQREKLKRNIEKTLPDLLLSISSTELSFEKILNAAASIRSPAAVPFKNCAELISKGMPYSVAISTSFSNYSPIVSKTGELLLRLYKNGNSNLALLREFSLQLAQHNAAKETAKADLSVQKYSLLISSAFLVPFIIALIYSTSLRAASTLSASIVSPTIVAIAINCYLFLFCFLSAKFLSSQFSTHFYTVFFLTAPLSLLVFNLSTFLLA